MAGGAATTDGAVAPVDAGSAAMSGMHVIAERLNPTNSTTSFLIMLPFFVKSESPGGHRAGLAIDAAGFQGGTCSGRCFHFLLPRPDSCDVAWVREDISCKLSAGLPWQGKKPFPDAYKDNVFPAGWQKKKKKVGRPCRLRVAGDGRKKCLYKPQPLHIYSAFTERCPSG